MCTLLSNSDFVLFIGRLDNYSEFLDATEKVGGIAEQILRVQD